MFTQINPQLQQRYDMAALQRKWNPAATMMMGEATPGTILTDWLQNPELVEAYVAALSDIVNQPPAPEMVETMADRVFALMAPIAMTNESRSLFDPAIGRPGRGLNEWFAVMSDIEYMLENYGKAEWMSPAVARSMMSRWLHTRLLEEAIRLYFSKRSVGWLSEDEMVATFEALEEAVSEESKAVFLAIWVENGGDSTDFDQIWGEYVSGMRRVEEKLKKQPFRQEARRGAAAYVAMFQQMQVPHSVQEISQWAFIQYNLVTNEMDRIAALMGYSSWKMAWQQYTPEGEPLPDDERLATIYQTEAEHVLPVLIQNELILPLPPGCGWTVQETPAPIRTVIPLLACDMAPYGGTERNALLYVTPIAGDDAARRQHAMVKRLWTAHELGGHAFGSFIAPEVVPINYVLDWETSLWGHEAVAFTMECEFLLCPGVNPLLAEMLGMLHGRAWRYARILAETAYHTTDQPFEEIVAEYAERSQLSLQVALRDMRRAAQKIGQFLAYCMGASALQQMGNYYEGGVKEALAYYQKMCGGYVLPNLFLMADGKIADPAEFKWLCELDYGVQVARQLVK